MTRKMTTTNEALFEKLESLLPAGYIQTQRHINRWLATTNTEKNWLKNAKFEKDEQFNFGGNSKLALIYLDNQIYLIFSELNPDLPENDFERQEINSGIFCASIFELSIQPLKRNDIGFEIADNVFIPTPDFVTTGKDYKLESIEKFFPKMYLYKIHSKSPFSKLKPILPRVGLFAITKCNELHSLNWTQTGLEKSRIISTLDIDIFPHELTVRAIVEKKWEHAFLEIYRSIEFLYPFPKINELKEKLDLSISTQNLSDLIEDTLGWRPIEEPTLQALFKDLPQNLLDDFNASFTAQAPDTLPTTQKMASLIYRLRNDCVHFRPLQKRSNSGASVKWDLLLQTMLSSSHFFYEKQITSEK